MTANNAPTKASTGAVVVTYHPDGDISPRIRAIAAQVDRLIIVDNRSSSMIVSHLQGLAEEIGADLICNRENMGMAYALNQALEWAGVRNYRWILTMDQDSMIYGDAMEAYSQAWESCPFRESIALLGGNYLDKHNKTRFHSEHAAHSLWSEVTAVITSGSLLSLPISNEIGSFREEFFIDQVDFDYCLRARSRGYRVVVTERPVMDHVVSSPIKKRFLGRSLSTPNAPALRRYYLIRNYLVLAREYLFKEPKWVLSTIKDRTKELILMILLEDNRLQKTTWLLRGLWDGLRHRMGRVAEQ